MENKSEEGNETACGRRGKMIPLAFLSAAEAQPQNWNIPPLPYFISLPNRTLSSSSDQNADLS